MKKRYLFLVVLMLLAALLTGCTTAEKPVYVTGDAAEEIRLKAEPMAQNILTGIQNEDYALFSTNFDDAMKKAMTEESFATLVKSVGKLGAPEKVELLNVEDQGNYYGVNFGLTYGSAKVTMRLVLAKSDLSLVSGLWFK